MEDTIVDWKDFSGTPQTPPATIEEKSIIEKIELRIEKSKNLLRENKMAQGDLNAFILFLRNQMIKLYGINSETTKFFSWIKVKLDIAIVREKASILIEQLENFVTAVKEIGAYSLNGIKKGKIFIGHGHSPLWRELKDFSVG